MARQQARGFTRDAASVGELRNGITGDRMKDTGPTDQEVARAQAMAEHAGLQGEPFGRGAQIADYRLLKRIERIEAYLGITFIADDLRDKDVK